MPTPRVRRSFRGRKLSSLIEVQPGPQPTPCWIWMGSHHRGYGYRWIFRQRIDMHVFTYLARYGEIPAGAVLDHLCRNRGCCNPSHLEVVTAAENCRRGANTKLDWGKVSQIRSRRAAGEKLSVLAAEFNLTEAAVSLIASGKRWGREDRPHHRK